jgi:hypothetical protein
LTCFSPSAVPVSFSFPFSSIVVPISSPLIRKAASSWIVLCYWQKRLNHYLMDVSG